MLEFVTFFTGQGRDGLSEVDLVLVLPGSCPLSVCGMWNPSLILGILSRGPSPSRGLPLARHCELYLL